MPHLFEGEAPLPPYHSSVHMVKESRPRLVKQITSRTEMMSTSLWRPDVSGLQCTRTDPAFTRELWCGLLHHWTTSTPLPVIGFFEGSVMLEVMVPAYEQHPTLIMLLLGQDCCDRNANDRGSVMKVIRRHGQTHRTPSTHPRMA